jgi:hypothetical protein
MAIQRLTAAYRSRSRPSSTLGAKASTMCPYYLDGDLFRVRTLRSSPGDTRYIGYCAVFKVREEARSAVSSSRDRSPLSAGDTPVSQNSTACDRGHPRLATRRPRPARSGRHASDRNTRNSVHGARELEWPSPASGALAMEGSLERR